MENERDLPWMYWLAGCFSVRRKTKEKLLDMYGTAENIYNMKKQVLNESGFLTDREKEAFCSAERWIRSGNLRIFFGRAEASHGSARRIIRRSCSPSPVHLLPCFTMESSLIRRKKRWPL